MRKKPIKVAFLQEVKITREGDFAHIDFIDPNYASRRIQFRPGELASMTDEDILRVHNEIVLSQQKLVRESRPTEVPDGEAQIEFDNGYRHWIPRSDVLRCELTSGEDSDDLVVCIDDEELSLLDFGEMLKMHMGWGMRVMFLPQEQLINPPPVEIKGSTQKD